MSCNYYRGKCLFLNGKEDGCKGCPIKKAYNKGVRDTKKDYRPQCEWIPVSERLPEERINPRTNDFEEVICTTVWGDVRHIKYGKPIGHDEPHFWYAAEIWDKYIISWQYKPEPYQKGDAE